MSAKTPADGPEAQGGPNGARGYSWPPFAPGHELSTKHGAKSARKVEPLARELAAQLLTVPGAEYLQAPRFSSAVYAWARAEAKCARVAEYLETMPIERQMESPKPGTAPPLEIWRRLEATALTHRGRLGLDPLSAARLGKDVAAAKVDIAKLLSDAQEAVASREAEEAP